METKTILKVSSTLRILNRVCFWKPIKINNYIHELPMISETTRISDALVRMQREHVHISLIIDEYGAVF